MLIYFFKQFSKAKPRAYIVYYDILGMIKIKILIIKE